MKAAGHPFTDEEDEEILATKPRYLALLARQMGRNPTSVKNRRRYLDGWDSYHSPKQQERVVPVVVPLARPDWFDERIDKARLMAGR